MRWCSCLPLACMYSCKLAYNVGTLRVIFTLWSSRLVNTRSPVKIWPADKQSEVQSDFAIKGACTDKRNGKDGLAGVILQYTIFNHTASAVVFNVGQLICASVNFEDTSCFKSTQSSALCPCATLSVTQHPSTQFEPTKQLLQGVAHHQTEDSHGNTCKVSHYWRANAPGKTLSCKGLPTCRSALTCFPVWTIYTVQHQEYNNVAAVSLLLA